MFIDYLNDSIKIILDGILGKTFFLNKTNFRQKNPQLFAIKIVIALYICTLSVSICRLTASFFAEVRVVTLVPPTKIGKIPLFFMQY